MTLTHNIIGAVQEIFSLNVTLDWPWLNSRRQTYNIVSAPFATCALPWLDFLVSDFLVNHLKSECVMILFGCAWRNFEKFGNQVMINLQNVFQIITSSDSKSIKEFGAWLLSRGLLSFARLMYHIMSRFREAQFSEILQTLSSKLEDLTNAYCVSNITNISRLWSRIMDQALSRVLSIRNHAAGRIIAGNELSEAENLARSIARLELNRASNFATWSGVKLDMPGELSELGPRHENDFADISQIHCIPTLSELLSVRENFLGLSHRNAPHHLEGISRLLDSQFRLLREDLIAPMRNSIRAVACLLMKADTDGVSYSKSLSLNSNGRLMTSIKDRSTKVSQAYF